MSATPLSALDSIPIVSDKEACPTIRAIFEDIKETLGVPFVNLIWRHLATIPGGLELTWSVVKPLYFSEIINQTALSLRKDAPLVKSLTPWPEPVLTGLGITAHDKSEIIVLLEDYGHANSRALLVLSYLHRSITTSNRHASIDPTERSSAVTELDPLSCLSKHRDRLIKPARPLPVSADLPISVSQLVKILNTFGAPIASPAEPSLYRHLSYWPSFLSAFWLAVEPLEQRGSLAREAIAMTNSASKLVEQWKPATINPDMLAAKSIEQVLHGIDHFTHAVIGRMIVLGDMMKRMIN